MLLGLQKKVSLFMKCFLMIGGVMLGTVYADPSQTKEILVGISPYYQPFEYYDGTEIIGFDVDLIHAIAKELGWKIKLKEMPFDELISALKAKRVDLAISGINMIPERLREIDFSQSYHKPHSLVWVYLPDQSSPDKSMETMKVGIQRGTYLQEWVNNQQKIRMNIQAVDYSSTPELFHRLLSKEVDVIVVEEVQAAQYDKAHPGKISYHATDVMIEGYGVAFPKGSLLKKKVNCALETLASSGKIKALQEKWIQAE